MRDGFPVQQEQGKTAAARSSYLKSAVAKIAGREPARTNIPRKRNTTKKDQSGEAQR